MTTLINPHDLLSAVPFLLGYKPENSIVIILLREEFIDLAVEIELEEGRDPKRVASIIDRLKIEGPDGVLLITYTSAESETNLQLLNLISDELEILSIPLRESILVKEGIWLSLLCSDENCCPPHGSPIPIIEESRIAAEQVVLGVPLPLKNVEELVKSIAPLPEDPEIIDFINIIPKIDYHENPLALQREGAEAIVDFIAEFTVEGLCRDKRLIALILVRLEDLQVRDFALGCLTRETLDIYLNAWRWLIRIAPRNYIAPVAVLLAATAYERGDTVLAYRALERARLDNPTYPMTKLLHQVFTAGWPRQALEQMRRQLHPKICEALFSGTINS